LKRLPFLNIYDLTRYLDGSKQLDLQGATGVSLSTTCQDFLGELLKPNPVDRPTANSARNHPWVAAGLPPLDTEESLVYQLSVYLVLSSNIGKLVC